MRHFPFRPTAVLRRVAALALLLLTLTTAAYAQSKTPAGTVITNRARLVYTEPDGNNIASQTNDVIVSVAAVNGLSVTPDEATPNGEVDANDRVTASFGVCNTGNTRLAYVVGGASVSPPASLESVYLDADSSGTVTAGDVQVSLGVTRTPAVAQGECSPVLVVYSTNNAAAHSQLTVTLTAHSPDDAEAQRVEDSGTVVRGVKDGPRISHPNNPSLPP